MTREKVKLPVVPYGGLIQDARFTPVLKSYVITGFLVEDADGNHVHPPKPIRTSPILFYQEKIGKLVTVDSFYSVHNVLNGVPPSFDR